MSISTCSMVEWISCGDGAKNAEEQMQILLHESKRSNKKVIENNTTEDASNCPVLVIHQI